MATTGKRERFFKFLTTLKRSGSRSSTTRSGSSTSSFQRVSIPDSAPISPSNPASNLTISYSNLTSIAPDDPPELATATSAATQKPTVPTNDIPVLEEKATPTAKHPTLPTNDTRALATATATATSTATQQPTSDIPALGTAPATSTAKQHPILPTNDTQALATATATSTTTQPTVPTNNVPTPTLATAVSTATQQPTAPTNGSDIPALATATSPATQRPALDLRTNDTATAASTLITTHNPTVPTNNVPVIVVCPDPNELWQSALDIAQKKLSERGLPPLDVSKHLSATSGDQSASNIVGLTIGDLQATIEAKQQCGSGKTTIIIGRLKEMLKMFDKYAVIVDTAIQSNPQITALVWAGVRLVLQVALNHTETVENLEKATAMIVEKMAICDFYASVYMETTSLKTTLSDTSRERLRHTLDSALPELYAAILVFSVKVQVYFSPSTNGIGKKVLNMLKPFVHEFQPFIEDMLEKEKVLRECADISIMNTIMENSGKLKEIQGLLKDIELELAPLIKLNEMVVDNLNLTKDISRNMEDDKVQKLLQLLSPLEPQKRHQDVRASRLEGTGTWLLNHERFLQWAEGPTQEPSDRILSCSGIPGAGKTVISSLVFDDLVSRFPQRDKAAIACLYCDYRDKSHQTLDNLLGSVVKQFLTAISHVPVAVTEMLEVIQKEGKKMEKKDALQALKLTLLQLDRAFLCIDALDELEPKIRKELLGVLHAELTGAVKLRLFLTGRPHIPSEVNAWLQIQQVPIEIRANPEDIRDFLIHEIACDPRSDEMNGELQREIVNVIIEKSDGMFLLPALQIRFVLEQPTRTKRRKSLYTLPKTLDEAFESTIDRIKKLPSSVADMAMKVLNWLHLAYRPLQEPELQHALAAEVGDSELDPDNIPSRKTYLDSCLGLVTVDEETSTVRFVHYTLEEHFRKNGKVYFAADYISGVAETCLTYLNFGKLAYHCTTEEELSAYTRDFTLLEYAATHWGDYVRQQWIDSAPMVASIMKLMEHESEYPPCALQVLYSHWHWQYLGSGFEPWPAKFSGTHVIAYFGLHELMHIRELASRQDWNAKGDNGRTPLSWAAGNGHEAVVRLLVEREDVDADSKDEWGRTPLSWAAGDGHGDVVLLLVERDDVDADSKGKDGRTPLSVAAEGGHEAVVRLLVEGDDVDAGSKDELGRTPLSWAAYYGREAVVRLLVERDDVDADSKDKGGRTPLLLAVEKGREAVVRLLVERDDVDADSKDELGRTPLSLAAENGREAVVLLLVERDDVDADSKDKGGRTPLSWAAEYGHEAVVRLLVEREDVDADSQDNEGKTALHWATDSENFSIVEILRTTAHPSSTK